MHIKQKLDYLASLSGMTCFEQEFVAILRSRPEKISDREMLVLEQIWNRHGIRNG